LYKATEKANIAGIVGSGNSEDIVAKLIAKKFEKVGAINDF
jgi:hypothetical protein